MTRTRQEAFDLVLTHLRHQGCRAFRTEPSGFQVCLYRTADGRRCAIGCLIPDEKYNPSFEFRSIEPEDIYNCRDILDAAGLDHKDAEFAEALQGLHDGAQGGSSFLQEIEGNAARLARRYGVTYTAPRKEAP